MLTDKKDTFQLCKDSEFTSRSRFMDSKSNVSKSQIIIKTSDTYYYLENIILRM